MISSISRRLFTAFACVILLLGAQGILMVMNQRHLMSEMQRLNQSCDDAQDLLSLVHQLQTDAGIVVGSRNPAVMDEHLHRLQSELPQAEQRLSRLNMDPSAFLQLKASYERATELQYQLAFEMAYQELNRSISIHDLVAQMVEQRLNLAESLKAEALRQTQTRTLAQSIILGVLSIALALFWAWYLQRFFTDRRKAESSLASALHRLQDVLDSATQVAIIMTSPEGLVHVFNTGAERLTGWKASDVVDRKSPSLWHDPDEVEKRRLELQALGHTIRTPFDVFVALARQNQPERRRWTFITREGARRTVDLVITRVNGLKGEINGFLGIATDITQQVEAESILRDQEEQLRQTQKMDAIGQLAGGIAHDFNNMLAGILGAAELLSGEFPPGDRRANLIQSIVTASQRTADLTRKLLAFSRKGKVLSTPFSLHRILHETVAILQRSIDRSIEIQLDLCEGDPTIVGDPSQIENALLNICINARDAMPEGGTLKIHTWLREEGSQSLIGLRIADTGQGIPPEILPRIFEPFFTTKPLGKGTGLGLAAVYGIVHDHHGTMKVDSNVGQGTTFTLEFPVETLGVPMDTPESPSIHQGMGTVLVIDDEELIRTTLSLMLGSAGYQVLQAEDGMEGLKLFQQHKSRIRLVVLDLVLPGISGRETYRRIHSLDPRARVIISSGFNSDLSTTGLQEEGLRGFLHKPFSRNELMKAVEAALA